LVAGKDEGDVLLLSSTIVLYCCCRGVMELYEDEGEMMLVFVAVVV
jgi:hypothetical protein